jgi:hypothetical protein
MEIDGWYIYAWDDGAVFELDRREQHANSANSADS